MPASSRFPDRANRDERRRQGGSWVTGQTILMATVAIAWLLPPRWPDGSAVPLALAGAVAAVAGAALMLWAHRSLGPSFSTLPEPPRQAALVERGPYRRIRHPMYAGGLLLFGGLSLAFSAAALVPLAVLAAFWWLKASEEERRLESRFPDYAEYRQRTPHRLIPFVV
jgi:protein-S-isoprenylcysteine O-methyltransferase Ste14